jgi:hypothetical protein
MNSRLSREVHPRRVSFEELESAGRIIADTRVASMRLMQ